MILRPTRRMNPTGAKIMEVVVLIAYGKKVDVALVHKSLWDSLTETARLYHALLFRARTIFSILSEREYACLPFPYNIYRWITNRRWSNLLSTALPHNGTHEYCSLQALVQGIWRERQVTYRGRLSVFRRVLV